MADYISNKIAVYKTDKKLVEFRDKLNPSGVLNYAEMHGRKDEQEKVYSVIGVTLLDYSNGTGNNTVSVNVNVSPEDILWIHTALETGKPDFELEQTKIFGNPDQKGYSQMTKLKIVRAEKDKSGNPRRYPWCIYGENGRGIAQKTGIGGSYCKGGSYVCERKVFLNISDYDMFKLISRVARFINQWENAYIPALIRQGRAAYEDARSRGRSVDE